MRVGLLAVVAACGFKPASAPAGRDGGVNPDDAMADADLADANDAMESNARRKLITFDHTKVAEADQNDFPVWIDVTDADVMARARADGRDIYFTADDGTTRLDHELAGWSNGHLTAWVRIPKLGHGADTRIYVCYGDLGAAPAPNPPGVFKASYAAVWHLDDAIDAAAIKDATNSRPGTPSFTAATTRAPGKLGTGFLFTDSNDTISFTNPLTGDDPHTISVWVNQTANISHTAAILALGTGMGGQSRWLHGHYTNNSFAVGYYGPDIIPNPAQVIDGAGWTRLDWVFEGPNSKNHLYRNGVEIQGSPITTTGAIHTMGTAGNIGFAPEPAYGGNNGYEGTIDELRIATVKRSPGWIATEYANQNAPSTFYAVGPEQL